MKGRHTIQKSKTKPLMILLIAICIIGGAIYYLMRPTGQDSATVKVNYQELSGQIIGTGDEVVRVRQDDNQEYLMAYPGIQATGDEMIIGNKITVYYTGKLDPKNNDIQSAKVGKIAVQGNKVCNVSSDSQASTTVSKKISDLLRDMTVEEKVAQLFMVRVPDDGQVSFVENHQPGGYILFGQDFKGKSIATVKANIQNYQSASKVKMLIGTDEEGGTVSRLKELYGNKFKSPQDVYNNGGMDAIIADTKEKSQTMKNLGLNLNFAPDSDISTSPDDFIYARSFGKGAKETSEYVSQVIKEYNNNKMGSILKHFPGYGNNGDSHTDVITDNRPLETFKNSDFLPFQAGIKSGANCILVAHNIMACVDTNPSSLSKKVHDLLRNEMNYNGVIMSDDLLMEGVRKLDNDGNIAIRAIQAGNDMIISSNPNEQLQPVINAVKQGQISMNQIDTSVLRILAWKQQLSIIE